MAVFFLSKLNANIFIGTFDKGSPLRYRINNCTFYMECSKITNLQWRGLYRDYRRTCSSNCKVCRQLLEKKCILHLKMSVKSQEYDSFSPLVFDVFVI